MAQLCPGGMLGPRVSWCLDDGLAVSVRRAAGVGSTALSGRSGVDAVEYVSVKDGRRIAPPRIGLDAGEAEACRAHLRVSCGLPEP